MLGNLEIVEKAMKRVCLWRKRGGRRFALLGGDMRMAQRVTEEDVLHATHLPTFAGQLSDEDADDS